MIPELLPCPCCGSEAELVKSYSYGSEVFIIQCGNCVVCTNKISNQIQAISQWNKRVDREDAEKYRRLMKSLGNMPTEHPPIWDSRNMGQ